jgi:hypothetical protein
VSANGPRYACAAESAAHIINLLAGDHPGGKAQLYGRALFAILSAIYAADEAKNEIRFQPSEN